MSRGFIALPITAYVALGAAAVIILLSIALKVQGARLDAVKAEYATFKAQVEVLGKQAAIKAKEKETTDAKAIQTALGERDAALNKLRDNARSRDLSASAAAPAGSSQVSFSAPAYDAAVERYRGRLAASVGRIAGLATEGDAVAIDAEALIKAWPSP